MRKTLAAAALTVGLGGIFAFIGNSDCLASEKGLGINQQLINVRYALSATVDKQTTFYDAVDDMATGARDDEFEEVKQKSPAKAFLLSLAVPGLGQLYYGSKVKPILFAGAEAAAWIFHAKYNSDGDQMIADYEAFNRTHWSEISYSDYLEAVYGVRDDEDVQVTEISHHLPDTRTQQYYEMTGKYNQFSWGWDDARLNDSTLTDWIAAGGPPAITSPALTPYSARRIAYEDMRGAANDKHRNADRLLGAILLNHVASAFEAFFMTKKRNSSAGEKKGEFGGEWKITPSLKSYSQKYDTPYIKVTYKF